MTGEVERREDGHGDGCGCARCVGFQRGNAHALRHGSYGGPVLATRAAEHAAAIRDLVPAAGEGDEYAVAGLALIAARIERVSEALDQLDGDDPLRQYRDEVGEKLRQDARAWLRVGLRYCEALGLTPSTRARRVTTATQDRATAAAPTAAGSSCAATACSIRARAVTTATWPTGTGAARTVSPSAAAMGS